MGYASATIEALATVHTILTSLQSALAPTAFSCPTSVSIDTIQNMTFDYVIVGGGEAGSVLAYRMAETNASVLVIEEGGCAPWESTTSGYFTTLPNTTYDRKMPIQDDGYSCQNQNLTLAATAGVMLGGSSSLNHLIYVPPFADDYTSWVSAANDSSWGYSDIAAYFAKGETCLDAEAIAQNTTVHGTSGPTKISKQSSPLVKNIIEAHEALNFTYLADAHGGESISEPLLFIADKVRQSTHQAYLSKLVNQTSVRFLTNAVATKIIFNGTTATGVQFTYNDTSYSVTAGKVIISAGALKTPQLLMLSGIGNATVLENLGIESVVDNPAVGQNLMDHAAAVTAISWDSDETTASANPAEFPVPMVTAYDSINKNATQPIFQNIGLYFTPAHSGLLQLLTASFKYINDIVDKFYEANIGKTMFMMVCNHMHPESRGSVTINSTDIADPPIINLGLFSNDDDLDLMATQLTQYVGPLLETEEFQNLNATLVDLDLCTNYTQLSYDFWKCYALEMSSTMWHYSGTAALGSVVDSSLNVIGTTNLKVVDASVFPNITTGNIGGVVRAVAEKAADIIKNEDGLTDVNE